MEIGVELSSMKTSNRARGEYLVSELSKLGYNIRSVDAAEYVDIRITLSRNYNRIPKESYLIFDISDPVLTPPRSIPLVDKVYQYLLLNRRAKKFFSTCNCIVVASREQKRIMNSANPNVHVIPDSSYYHSFYQSKFKKQKNRPIVYVWDGQGHNFPNIEVLLKNNLAFFRRKDIVLRVITDEVNSISGVNNRAVLKSYGANTEFIEWNENSFMQEVSLCDVGLAPIDMRCPHSMAKPCNKIVNYLGLGLFVLASPTFGNVEYTESSSSGIILCKTLQDWENGLSYPINSGQDYFELASIGREHVVSNYSQEALSKKWADILSKVLFKNS